jgi:LysM repeat protein
MARVRTEMGVGQQVTADPATTVPPAPEKPKTGGGLSKKIGPLPAWAWAALAGVGALGYYLWKKQSSSSADAAASTSPQGSPCTDANGGAGTVDASGNCITAASSSGGSGSPCTDANGNAGVTDANGDCTAGGLQNGQLWSDVKNLQGEESTLSSDESAQAGDIKTLTSDESAQSAAIKKLQTPPKSAPKVTPKPAPEKPAAKPKTYTVRKGDTLTAIAARYKISLKSLEAANRQIKNYNLIYPGQKINIP